MSIANAPVARGMHDFAALRMTRCRIDLPLLRRRGNKQHACGCTGLSHGLPCITDRCRSTGQLAAEQRVHEELFVRWRVIDHDAVQRHFQFFRDQHRDGRIDSLAHFDLGNYQRHLARRIDLYKCVRLEHAVLRRFVGVAADHRLTLGRFALARGRHAETKHQAAACRSAD